MHVIDTLPTHVRNCCPGSVTGVVWHGWSRDWCARGAGIDSRGTTNFVFQLRLEREDSEKMLGIGSIETDSADMVIVYTRHPLTFIESKKIG